jgi:hypothetical protein
MISASLYIPLWSTTMTAISPIVRDSASVVAFLISSLSSLEKNLSDFMGCLTLIAIQTPAFIISF